MIQKPNLTAEEAIKVAYFRYVMGLLQHDVAVILNVNQGRIAEACTALKYAADNIHEVYEIAIAAKAKSSESKTDEAT